MLNPARKTLLMLGAFCALAVGGSALAGAASKSNEHDGVLGVLADSARPQRPTQDAADRRRRPTRSRRPR